MLPDWAPMVMALSSLLGTAGGLVVMLRKLEHLQTKDEAVLEHEQETTLYNELREELRAVRSMNQALQDQCQQLLLENAENKAKLVALESEIRLKTMLFETAHLDLPFPQWIKDEHGVMQSINAQYVDMVLKPLGLTALDYLGKTDHDVFPKEIADAFLGNDRNVWETGQAFRGLELVSSPDGPKWWFIVKFLRTLKGQKLGVAGVALPMEWIPDLPED